jgi:hypothetical protein
VSSRLKQIRTHGSPKRSKTQLADVNNAIRNRDVNRKRTTVKKQLSISDILNQTVRNTDRKRKWVAHVRYVVGKSHRTGTQFMSLTDGSYPTNVPIITIYSQI